MLDAAAVHGWCREALDVLGRAREEIDALNVYPVPDADTGTNLYLTMEAALDELDTMDHPDAGGDAGTGSVADPGSGPGAGYDGLAAAVRAVTRGALVGAHGNSGAILSQLLRGAGDSMLAAESAVSAEQTDPVPADAAQVLARALTAAANAAYAAVANPVEGTILTVIRAAAAAAERTADAGQAAAVVARAAADAAETALAMTPQQLPVLARAGVVDAGGRGLTVLLDLLARSISGLPESQRGGGATSWPTAGSRVAARSVRWSEPEVAGPRFEVMYLLEADERATVGLRAELESLGDSLLVVGGDKLWNVHVHVDDPGAAVEAGVRAGRPHRIRVTHLGSDAPAVRPGAARVVVAFATGSGVARLVEDCGAVVLPGGALRRTSSHDLLSALRGTDAREVVLLPDDPALVPAVEAAADSVRIDGVRVAVLPTRAAVQVLAALAVHDPGRRFEDDVVAMTAAARATRTGSVTFATAEALTSAGVCRPGDVLGIVEDDVAEIGAGVEEVALRVLDRMLSAGGELVTLVVGAGIPESVPRDVRGHLRHSHPGVDVTSHRGEQELWPLLIGVE